MAFTNITVTGTWQHADGTSATGKVEFVLSRPVANSNVIISNQPIIATLNGSGSISTTLVANDDTGTFPTGTFYLVTEQLIGAAHTEYEVVIPHSAVSGTIDISTLMPNTQPATGGA